jgi:hypothetical protein
VKGKYEILDLEAVKNLEQRTIPASRGRESGVSVKVNDLLNDGKPRTHVAGLAASARRRNLRFTIGKFFTVSERGVSRLFQQPSSVVFT